MKLLENLKQNYKQLSRKSKFTYILGLFFGGLSSVFALLSLLNDNNSCFSNIMYIFLSFTWMFLGLSDLWNPNRKDIVLALLSFGVSGLNLIIFIIAVIS